MIDFKSELESTFTGIPNYGEVFALEINQKFFRAIRTDTEVSYSLCWTHFKQQLTVSLIVGNEYIDSSSFDRYWWNDFGFAKRLQIQFVRWGKTNSANGNSMPSWKGIIRLTWHDKSHGLILME